MRWDKKDRYKQRAGSIISVNIIDIVNHWHRQWFTFNPLGLLPFQKNGNQPIRPLVIDRRPYRVSAKTTANQ